MARVNINILGISELKWTGMDEFNSDDHYIYYCGQESLRRNGVSLIVNKRAQNAVLGCNLKNDRMNSGRFHGKPLDITVTQVYVPTTNAEEAEVELFYADLQDLLANIQKRCPFHHKGFECKSKKNTIKERLAEYRSQKHVSKFLSNLCLISGLYCEGEVSSKLRYELKQMT